MLEIDCAISPDLLSVKGIDALSALEPCGNGCPKPVLMLENMTVERVGLVGNGRHMRLRLRQGRHSLNAICFGTTPESASIVQGDVVDVAFQPQVNEFRGERSVQLNVLDIRPSCQAECDPDSRDHRALCAGTLSAEGAQRLLPDRATLGLVWRYLAACGDSLQETPICLCRKIVRHTGLPLGVSRLLTCLDIFADVGLIELQRRNKYLHIRLPAPTGKADLQCSATMQKLVRLKES